MNKNQSLFQQQGAVRFRRLMVILILASSLQFDAYGTIAGSFLSVDFNTDASLNETGFESFRLSELPSKTFLTTEGNLTVASTGGNMSDRGNVVAINDSGAFTYAELYRDFHFEQPFINFTLSGPAIVPNKQYRITWYSYSTFDPGTTQFGPTPASNTSGSIGSVAHMTPANQPTSNDQYSFTGIWSSTDNSLEITATLLSGTINAVNGFEIVPEPSTVILLAFSGLTLLLRRHRA